MAKKDRDSLKNPKDKNQYVRWLKKSWYFVWYDDSLLSWVVNLILAFVIIKFLLYPGLGALFQTTHPVVAVVSGSMEHNGSFDGWWSSPAYCGAPGCTASCLCTQQEWYLDRNINRDMFEGFPFKNGFNKGDIIVLLGVDPAHVQLGDVIVFQANKPYPIIHRVVRLPTESQPFFQTKGDNNMNQIVERSGQTTILDEKAVGSEKIIGRAVFKIPWLGYIKIWFSDYVMSPIMGLFVGNES